MGMGRGIESVLVKRLKRFSFVFKRVALMGLCKHCNKWISQPEGKRKKEFCNNTCRSNFWYGKNKKGKKKGIIEFKAPAQESFDGPKLLANIHDEPLSFEKLKKEIPAPKGVSEYTAELDQAEDLAELERIGRQIEKSNISWKDKQLLKAHGQGIAQNKFFY